ncbi:hypothetical protein FZC35_01505 [Candidatus Cytomitobacter indipagum]|uniref:Uncharacterized protein n=1 Tax=Candidatus Cytomitobacter indipagum TaxID=2601575 RepID=A0A5C0UEB4_9PROT|nr:hypothetical protein [Candidatus Cytomitobacter indipagum]QEK38047.1 hypothetical protein FZC35_01505 [Candidatus Cytomitobacter indipagum]
MNLILKYEVGNYNVIDSNQCTQTLEANSFMKRSINGDPIIVSNNNKYTSSICGFGSAPEIRMNEIMILECALGMNQNIKPSEEIKIDRNIVPGSLFLITADNKRVYLKSIDEAESYDGLKLNYRIMLKVKVIKLTSEFKYGKSTWKLELEEI